MAGLCRVFVDRAATRDALARRQFGMVFDGTDQQIKRVPRMRLDKFELPEFEREGYRCDCRSAPRRGGRRDFPSSGIVARCHSHTARIRASIVVNRQQRVHRAGYGDERPANAAGGAKICKISRRHWMWPVG